MATVERGNWERRVEDLSFSEEGILEHFELAFCDIFRLLPNLKAGILPKEEGASIILRPDTKEVNTHHLGTFFPPTFLGRRVIVENVAQG